MFGLNSLAIKAISISATVALVIGFYYYWHAKPIKDLKEKNEEQGLIIKETEVKVREGDIKSDSFEDKWKTIKIITKGNSNEENSTKDTTERKPVDVDLSLGEHTLTL